MPLLASVLLVLTLVAAVVYGLAVIATLVHTARPRRRVGDARLPPVSLLKPLKGLEEDLEGNLTSVYAQRYPGGFEVVFATTAADDPSLAVARRVAAAHPEVPTRFVQSDPGFGLNPKVANLAGALSAARHDLVLQTDANVRLRPHYLHELVSEMQEHDADLLSSLVVGQGEQSLGAALHNVHLSAFIAPGTCLATVFAGIVVVIGKSMLFRRSDLEALGGLAQVRDVLAEDFILGRAYQRAGLSAWLSATRIVNCNVQAPIASFVERQTRWLKMRAAIHPVGYALDLLSNPVGLGLGAWAATGFAAELAGPWAVLVVLKSGTDAWLVRRTRGRPLGWRHAAVPLLRDLVLLTLWPWCLVSRTVNWRGARRRLGPDSVLEPVHAAPRPSLLR